MHEEDHQGTEVIPEASRGAPGISDATYRRWAVAILLLAAGLRVWAIDFGLPHLRTRPDEFPLVQLTLLPAEGNLDIGWPIYPNTYVYLTSLWTVVGLEIAQASGSIEPGDYRTVLAREPASLLLIARLLSAAAGTAAVWFVMLLARNAFGSAAGLSAGLLLASNFLHSRDSHAVKSDVLLSLAILVTLHCIVPLARRATLRRGLIAGVATGAAMGAKYPGILLAPAVYDAAWLGSGTPFFKPIRRFFPESGILAMIAAAGFLVATNPYVFTSQSSIDAWKNLVSFTLPFLPEGPSEAEGSSRLREEMKADNLDRLARIRDLPNPPRYGQGPWWSGFAHHATFSLRHGAGLLPTLLAPLAVIWAFSCWREPKRALTIPAAVFVVVYFSVFGVSPAQIVRYMTPLLPVILLLEVGMISDVISRWCQARSIAPRNRVALLAAATLLVGGESLANTVAHNRIAARMDTRNQATEWLASHTEVGARVKVLGTQFMPYGRPRVPKGRRNSNAKPNIEDLSRDGVGYVMTHDHFLYSSTVNSSVFEEISPYLELLAEFDPYVGGRGSPEDAVFEPDDPYYIPISGFASVGRPGPLVRIYAIRTHASLEDGK